MLPTLRHRRTVHKERAWQRSVRPRDCNGGTGASVAEEPEPLSQRSRDLSHRSRSHRGKHVPDQHIAVFAADVSANVGIARSEELGRVGNSRWVQEVYLEAATGVEPVIKVVQL